MQLLLLMVESRSDPALRLCICWAVVLLGGFCRQSQLRLL